MNVIRHRVCSRPASSERGQSFLAIVAFVGIFLLVVLGLATDYTQVWAHRQMAQAAADAACQAGAADLWLNAIDPSAAGQNGLQSFGWIGSSFDCSTNSTAPPCRYATINGYTGSSVSVTFPSSLPGVNAIPAGFGSVAHPYIQVRITDPVPMYFTKLVSVSTVNVGATAGCGLNPVAVPIPLVVLHRTAAGSLSVAGTATIKILGGPNRSVQVDSKDTGAVTVGTVDLHLAGPNGNGADFGVFGGPATKPTGVNLGTAGNWVQPAAPFGDPWVTVGAPSKPSAKGTVTPVAFGTNGCPDPIGCAEFTGGDYSSCSTSGSLATDGTANGCIRLPYGGTNPAFPNWADYNKNKPSYSKGDRVQPRGGGNPANCVFQVTTAGIPGGVTPNWVSTEAGNATLANFCHGQTVSGGAVTWINIGAITPIPSTAIFDPGLYYLAANGLSIKQATVRTSTAAGDTNNGVTFYFSATDTVTVTANAGSAAACTAAASGAAAPASCVVSYQRDGGNSPAATGDVAMRAVKCPTGTAPPSQVPATIDGDILLGPCTGTYGSSDGKNRGFLFFQAHSNFSTPSWGGGGQFLLSGFMYFHSNASGATCGTSTTCLNMDGGSGSGAFTLGNLVADRVNMTGNSGITMILNPASSFQVLRPTLLE
jgi:hypothetical protein